MTPGAALVGELAAGTAPSRLYVVGEAPVGLAPLDYLLGLPDLAHGELNVRLREVGLVDQLLDALAANAEQVADLGGSDEVMHDRKHRNKTTGHLTSTPATGETSHVTIEPLTSGNTSLVKPELRPFDPAGDPNSWVTEATPMWTREVNGFRYRTNADAVYRFYNAQRELLYIGMTTSRPSSRWTWHRKNAEWWREAAFVSVQWILDGTAKAVEKAAIQAEQPLYNKQHMRSRSSFMTFTRQGPEAIIEQFRTYLLPGDFAALVDAFKAIDLEETV